MGEDKWPPLFSPSSCIRFRFDCLIVPSHSTIHYPHTNRFLFLTKNFCLVCDDFVKIKKLSPPNLDFYYSMTWIVVKSLFGRLLFCPPAEFLTILLPVSYLLWFNRFRFIGSSTKKLNFANDKNFLKKWSLIILYF